MMPPLSMLERYVGIALALSLAAMTAFVTHRIDSAHLARVEARYAAQATKVAEAYASALEASRATEAGWERNLAEKDKAHADELARLRASRNPGPGAPVRVCKPADPGGSPASSSPALAAVAGEGAAPGGLVPAAVPEGADIGPMLRELIVKGDELSAQVRALLAEREGLVHPEPLF